MTSARDQALAMLGLCEHAEGFLIPSSVSSLSGLSCEQPLEVRKFGIEFGVKAD